MMLKTNEGTEVDFQKYINKCNLFFPIFFLNVIANYTTFRQGVISDMPEAVRANTIEKRKTNKKIYL